MTVSAVPDKSTLLTDLSPYIYGTGRLGDEKIPFDDRVAMARVAMDAGIWFHTSHTYGSTLSVLRAAFDQARAKVPKLIVKIGWSSLPELRDIVRQNLEPLAIDSLALGQLCLSGALAEDYANGGECYAEFVRLKLDVIVTVARAVPILKQATAVIPIVFALASDPVGE